MGEHALPEKIGAALRTLRESRGLTLTEAARRARMGRTALQNWEAGRHAPSGPSLARLLDALEVEPRRRARLLVAVDPRHARIELAHSEFGSPIDVGAVVRTMRARRGLTQADLARRAGVSQGTVAKWESGALEPSAETVHALGFALGARAEETLALAAARGGVDPFGEEVVPEEAPQRIEEALAAAGPLKEIAAMAYEAEAWRRASRDPRWDAALCLAVAERASHEYHSGAPGRGAVHAARALGLARTPETRHASMRALDVASEIARRRREDPAAMAEVAVEWAACLPEGERRAWAFWIGALRLAAQGKRPDAMDAMRRSVATHDAGWFERTNARVEVHLACGEPRAAAAAIDREPRWVDELVLCIRVHHANGGAAPETWMDTLRSGHSDATDRTWHDVERWTALERRQARLLKSQRVGVGL